MDLLDAVNRVDVREIQELSAKGVDPNRKDDHGRTPLMRAAEWSRAESARALIDIGAALDEQDERDMTALHHAASIPVSAAHTEVVRILLGAGADASRLLGTNMVLYHSRPHLRVEGDPKVLALTLQS